MSATRAGLAYALVAVTGVFYGVEYRLPRPVGMYGAVAGRAGAAGPAGRSGGGAAPTGR